MDGTEDKHPLALQWKGQSDHFYPHARLTKQTNGGQATCDTRGYSAQQEGVVVVNIISNCGERIFE